MPTRKGLVRWAFLAVLICMPALFDEVAFAYGWAACGPQGGLGSLIVDPTDSNHLIYLVGEHCRTYETSDGGTTWYSLGERLDAGETIVDIEATRYPTVDMVTQIGDYPDAFVTRYRRSADGGRSWSAGYDFSLGAHARVIKAHSAVSNLLYVLTESFPYFSIWKSVDGGRQWTSSGLVKTTFSEGFIKDLAILPGENDTLYVCGRKSVGDESSPSLLVMSDDGGTSWSDISATLPTAESSPNSSGLTSIALVPDGEGTIYVARGDFLHSAPIFRSTDGGKNWQWAEQSLYGNLSVTVDPFTPDHAIVLGCATTPPRLTDHGCDYVVSRDGGTTWSSRQTRFGLEAIKVVFDPAIRDRVYMCARQGLFRSDDGGENWTRIDNGIREARVWDVAVSGDRVYTLKAHEGICHSGDSGGFWWLPRNGNAPTTESFSIAVDPVRRARLLAVEIPRWIAYYGMVIGEYRVFQSDDGGSTWTDALGTDYLWTAVTFHPSKTGRAYAVGSDAVYSGYRWNVGGLYISRSSDYGQTWASVVTVKESYTDALEAKIIAVAPSNDNVIYVAGTNFGWFYSNLTEGNSDAIIYRSDDDGLTWNDALGNLGSFGRAPRGVRALVVDSTDPLHVFLGTSLGLFETSNGGQSWTRAMDKTLSVYDLALDPIANILYVATEKGVQRVYLSDMTWETLLAARYPEPDYSYDASEEALFGFPNLTIDPENRCLYLSGSDHGLLRFDLDQYNAVSAWALYE